MFELATAGTVEILPPSSGGDDYAFDGDPIFTPAEVALWLRTSSDELRKLRVGENGPTFLEVAPGAYRYRLSDLRAWLATRRFRTLPQGSPERGRVRRAA